MGGLASRKGKVLLQRRAIVSVLAMAKNRYDLFVLGVLLLGMHVGASDTCGVTGDCGVEGASLLQKHSTKVVKENNDHYDVDIKAGNPPEIRVEHYDVKIKDSSLTEKLVRNLMDKWFQYIGGDGSDPDLEKQALNTWASMFTPEACMTGFHLGFEDESQHGFVQEVCGVEKLNATFSGHMHTRGSPTSPIEVYQNKLEFKACVFGPESEIGTHREGMIAEHVIMVEGEEQLQISKAIGTLTEDGCS